MDFLRFKGKNVVLFEACVFRGSFCELTDVLEINQYKYSRIGKVHELTKMIRTIRHVVGRSSC
jgi:hypothetical protein